jgi:hypothetical protein
MYYRDATVHSMMEGAVILGRIFILGVDGKRGVGGSTAAVLGR